MSAPGLEEPALNQKLIALLRNFPLWPYGWHNNNIFEYLKKLYHLNRTLPANRRIALHFSDVPCSGMERPRRIMRAIGVRRFPSVIGLWLTMSSPDFKRSCSRAHQERRPWSS